MRREAVGGVCFIRYYFSLYKPTTNIEQRSVEEKKNFTSRLESRWFRLRCVVVVACRCVSERNSSQPHTHTHSWARREHISDYSDVHITLSLYYTHQPFELKPLRRNGSLKKSRSVECLSMITTTHNCWAIAARRTMLCPSSSNRENRWVLIVCDQFKSEYIKKKQFQKNSKKNNRKIPETICAVWPCLLTQLSDVFLLDSTQLCYFRVRTWNFFLRSCIEYRYSPYTTYIISRATSSSHRKQVSEIERPDKLREQNTVKIIENIRIKLQARCFVAINNKKTISW